MAYVRLLRQLLPLIRQIKNFASSESGQELQELIADIAKVIMAFVGRGDLIETPRRLAVVENDLSDDEVLEELAMLED